MANRGILGLLAAALLSACSPIGLRGPVAPAGVDAQAALATVVPARLSLQQAAQNFTEVVERVEPVAEDTCRRQSTGQNCDFQIGVEMDPRQPPNAYQTQDANSRPQIIFTIALIAEARNSDELAFVLGHEAAHHIRAHLAASEQDALRGAILGGLIASAGGGDAGAVERAQRMGAQLGALQFSKAHELEADELGTAIAYHAGYDPRIGAMFFARLPDPGDGFLNSHPANSQRQAVVAATYAQIAGG